MGMFFKRAPRDKHKPVAHTAGVPQPATNEVVSEPPKETKPPQHWAGAAGRPAPLSVSLLRRATNPETLAFKTTAELKPAQGVLGQDQMIAALSVGLRIKLRGHNVVVAGAKNPETLESIRAEINSVAATRPPPSDWVYVANFEERYAPRALELPTGHGRRLASAMDDAIGEMHSAIIAALSSDSYQTRWRAIDAEFQARHQAGLEELVRTADAHSIALLRTPLGYAVAPAHDGTVVSRETFSNMPPTMQADVRAQINAIEVKLSELLKDAPQADRQRRAELGRLNREVISRIAGIALAEPRRLFAGNEAVMDFLAAVEADVIASANDLLPTIDVADVLDAQQVVKVEKASFERYRVNVFVSWPPDIGAAPVVQELAPDHAVLFGTATVAAGCAPHMQLVPGLLHRANGGFLLLDARALTAEPRTWSALLTVLNAGAIRPAHAESDWPSSDASAIAEAIPLDVKVIVLSDADHLLGVLARDPRFHDVFKIEVVCADRVERSPETERALAQLIAGIVSGEGLDPLDVEAVAELIELSARLAGNRDELLVDLDDLAAMLRLADNLRAAASRSTISRNDIVVAQQARARQARTVIAHQSKASPCQRLAPSAQPAIGKVLRLVGRSAALAGQPSFQCVSARIQRALIRPASIDVSRIFGGAGTASEAAERTIKAYLAAEFGGDSAIALAAALDIEPAPSGPFALQATCAELLALLSAIAELPLPQSIAVAGAFDQFGNIRAEEGAINEAIEEFFAACRASAIEGGGVVIPSACLPQLMLRRDIVDAAAAGEFAVWSVATIPECVSVLTGISTGVPVGVGSLAGGDVYRRIDDSLRKFHDHAARPLSETGPAR